MPGATFLPILSYGAPDAASQRDQEPRRYHADAGDRKLQSQGTYRAIVDGVISRDGSHVCTEPPHTESVDAPGKHVSEANSVLRETVTRAQPAEKPRRRKKTKQPGTKEADWKRKEERAKVEAHVASLKVSTGRGMSWASPSQVM